MTDQYTHADGSRECRPLEPYIDLRPANCRFRLQAEGKVYPRSGCNACGAEAAKGLGMRCSRVAPTPPATSLFTDDQAPAIAPPTPKPPFTPEQQETLDRLARNPAALLLVNAARLQAVTKHGHTDTSDAELSMLAMPNKARSWIGDANEALRDERLQPSERRAIAIRKYTNAIALLLAQIDKLTLESERKESQ